MGLRPLMFMGRIGAFEEEGAGYIVERLWSGGIRELVLGDLRLKAGEVQGPAFAPNLEVYEGIERRPPELPTELEASSRILRDGVKASADKGFEVFFHDWGQGGGCLNNPEGVRYGLARTRDTFEHYPEASGFIMDGPEWGYEIEPGHRADVFACFCEHCEQRAEEWGYDFRAMKAAAERMEARLCRLSPEVMQGFIETQTGPFDTFDLLLQDPALFDWIRFKTESIQEHVGAFYRYVKELDPRLKLACGPRISAFAPLTGYNYRRLNEVTDFISPKLYFWMHGIDGLKGTVYRYAKTLMEWNEGVSESLALAFVNKLFGFTIPGVESLEDLSQPLSAAFFQETVASEIAKMVYRTGSVDRIKPWMGLHHGGVRLTDDELSLLLEAIRESPLESFIYWHYSDMSEEEWVRLKRIIS